MYCTQCGAPLRPGASFCGTCGWNIPTEQSAQVEVSEREARGLKLCVKCRSEIPLDADVCRRCDAPQPAYDALATQPVPQPSGWQEAPRDVAPAQPSLPLATIGRRTGAYLIDVVVLVMLAVIVIYALGIDPEDEDTQNQQFAIYILITFAYFIVCEALTGQTVGKRLTGIRVVGEDGAHISWGKSAGRNLLRIVDSLPALYIVGLIVMSRSDRLQRIGDRAAKTLVVMDSGR